MSWYIHPSKQLRDDELPPELVVTNGNGSVVQAYVPYRKCHDLGGTGANGEQVFNCDKCGCVLSLYDRDGSNNLCTSFVFDYPRFCPECGAEVVDA